MFWYNRNVVSAHLDSGRSADEQGVEDAFELLYEINERVRTGLWVEGEGGFHGALNFDDVSEAPVLFICRNNGWAISTPISGQFKSDGVVVKGPAYVMHNICVDGNDILAVYSAIRTSREMVILDQKPMLVEALTYQVGHHFTSDDSTKYRSTNEIEHSITARNPVAPFRKWVERKDWWNNEEETEHHAGIRKQVLKAIQTADKLKKPSLENLFTDVYDSLPPNL